MSQPGEKPERRRPCPICGSPAVEKFRPFCSKRCADVDLGRWFSGSYSVPAVEPPDGEERPDREEGDDEIR
jgi:endogenous inhibitor of DNA gyrase (YacG/DUF329 family)